MIAQIYIAGSDQLNFLEDFGGWKKVLWILRFVLVLIEGDFVSYREKQKLEAFDEEFLLLGEAVTDFRHLLMVNFVSCGERQNGVAEAYLRNGCPLRNGLLLYPARKKQLRSDVLF
ncbi:hypothetical protein JTB14_035393 [Gonioctena quinquepunctata]|nr:hypothetical protein JTB14_035393 [Gonioctena quinquepunctata]